MPSGMPAADPRSSQSDLTPREEPSPSPGREPALTPVSDSDALVVRHRIPDAETLRARKRARAAQPQEVVRYQEALRKLAGPTAGEDQEGSSDESTEEEDDSDPEAASPQKRRRRAESPESRRRASSEGNPASSTSEAQQIISSSRGGRERGRPETSRTEANGDFLGAYTHAVTLGRPDELRQVLGLLLCRQLGVVEATMELDGNLMCFRQISSGNTIYVSCCIPIEVEKAPPGQRAPERVSFSKLNLVSRYLAAEQRKELAIYVNGRDVCFDAHANTRGHSMLTVKRLDLAEVEEGFQDAKVVYSFPDNSEVKQLLKGMDDEYDTVKMTIYDLDLKDPRASLAARRRSDNEVTNMALKLVLTSDEADQIKIVHRSDASAPKRTADEALPLLEDNEGRNLDLKPYQVIMPERQYIGKQIKGVFAALGHQKASLLFCQDNILCVSNQDCAHPYPSETRVNEAGINVIISAKIEE